MIEEDLNEQLLASIFDSVSPLARIQRELYQTTFNQKQSNLTTTTTIDNEKWIENLIQGIQAANENEQKITTTDVKTNINSTTKNKEQTLNGENSIRL